MQILIFGCTRGSNIVSHTTELCFDNFLKSNYAMSLLTHVEIHDVGIVKRYIVQVDEYEACFWTSVRSRKSMVSSPNSSLALHNGFSHKSSK